MDEAELIIALILAIICAIPAGIFIELAKDYNKNRKYYDIVWKKSTSLKPNDLLGLRPYNSYYYNREEDEQVKKIISSRESVLLVGSPLTGKTRTLFESLINGERVYDIIKPKSVEISPSSIHIPKHFKMWRPRVAFFDDIHEFASRQNLPYLLKAFRDNNIPILATCRSGFELEKLDKAIDITQYFDKNVVKIESIDDKTGKMIAVNNHIEWREIKFNHTIGSIFMPLKAMEYRFNYELSEVEKRILRTIKKLYTTGLYKENSAFSVDWIKILSKCYQLNLSEVEWNTNLINLSKSGFIGIKYKGEKILEVLIEEAYFDYIIKFEGEKLAGTEIFYEVLSIFKSENELKALINIGLAAKNNGLFKDKKVYMQIALDAFTTCLKLSGNNKNKTEFAMLLNSLGKTYFGLASTKEDSKPDLEKSIKFLKKALEIRTKKKYPLEYAQTQNFLGVTYADLAKIENRKVNLEKTIKCYEETLSIKTIDKFPLDYAEAINNLGLAYMELAQEENTKENLEKTIKYCKESLLVRTKDKYPLIYASTINNLANAYNRIAEVSDDPKTNLEQSIKYYLETLEIKTKEDYPIHYAISHNNLGVSYTELAKIDPQKEHLYKSIEHFEEALSIRKKVEYPFDYASSQYNLGVAYMHLAKIKNKKENCCNAKKCYDEALKIFKKDKYPVIYEMMMINIGMYKDICKS
jgi:tetratricopeptide (TPR) repeat protein